MISRKMKTIQKMFRLCVINEISAGKNRVIIGEFFKRCVDKIHGDWVQRKEEQRNFKGLSKTKKCLRD